ncbi:MAG: hypothetical protein DMF94_07925 [Acidobacteria bacterium]|nr:MAG: hypothetical protein DMF94_07925 [Acidobacteriota bacterium]
MTGPAYPAARVVAPTVHAHFARHADEAHRRGRIAAGPPPDADTIEAIIDAAFWASLRREESYVPKISLAFMPPDAARHPLVFERPLPLAPGALVKVAPAVERAGIHLGVWRDDAQGLSVWGTIRDIPSMCLVVEVAAPGLLVLKHHRGEESGKFVNVAVLEGDQIKVVDERASSLPDCPPLLTSLLGFDSPATWVPGIDSISVLVQLAVSMRAHGRGGLLLVVPAGNDGWQDSIIRPIPYAVVPPFTELAQLNRDSADAKHTRIWQEAVNRAVDAVAGLTGKGAPQVEQVTVTEPIEGNVAVIVHPTALGGTRHLSAAQFVHDQGEAVALVASQDGRFTVFAWSPCEGTVHAHRVETLLL